MGTRVTTFSVGGGQVPTPDEREETGSMAGEVSKQDQALTRGAQMTSAARGDLEQQLGALRGKLAGIGAQWCGAGSSAFQQVMTRWDEDARKIISALNEFEANLQSSEQTYNANDEMQSQSFGKLAGRLG